MMRTDATDLPRLIQCVASYGMPGFTPPGMPLNEYQLEGDAAHWLAHAALSGASGDITEYVDRKAPNGHYIDADMCEHVGGYVRAVREHYGKRFIEQPMTLQLTDQITIDCRPDVITDEQGNGYRYIWIDDFKYGHRIVEAENNPVMLAYALAYAQGRVFGPETLFMLTIHQPRPYHVDGPRRVWCFGPTELNRLRAQMIARLTTPNPQLQTGPSCYKCPSRLDCVPHIQSGQAVFDMAAAPIPQTMPNRVMSDMRDQVRDAISRLENIADALDERITHKIKSGETVPNYFLESAVGPLAWEDYVTVDMLRMFTDKPVSKPEKPLTPTQLKRVIGEDIVKSLATRPNLGQKLVRRDLQQQAKKMFGKVQK